jgi:hypothetical protein
MPQLTSIAQHVILSELESLKREIELFPDDAAMWAERPGVTNTSGTLALHCAGNIQHFIGARLGGSGYVRDRDGEFSRRGATRKEVLAELDKAIAAVHRLDGKALSDLPPVFPDEFGGKSVNTDTMLVFLAVHLGYHLGQVDFHRRITTGNGVTANTIPARDLPSAT